MVSAAKHDILFKIRLLDYDISVKLIEDVCMDEIVNISIRYCNRLQQYGTGVYCNE